MCHLLKKKYPSELTIVEFREVMNEVLRSGGIDQLEYSYHLDRLLERVSSSYCAVHEGVVSIDKNTPFVDDSLNHEYQNVNELNAVKLPVKLLLTMVMHVVHGNNDDRLKALFRLFKECVCCCVLICRNDSKKMNRAEFENAVECLLLSYHLPVDFLTRKKKSFPLNDYAIATPQQLVDSALHLREEHSKIPPSASISRKEFIAMVTDQPLCIWGECYPVSAEEQKRLDALKEEREELNRLRKKEVNKVD